ncbi:transposase [Candidatus Bipolaricaulota bacterium]|nr:transposase [Candidatus Bipolaricaulota bacterium]
MARPLRIEFPGALYHITSRGNAGQEVFLDDKDRFSFLDLLGEVVERFHWRCYAYCLMPNHYHLLVETVEPTLSRGMRHLNGVYTQAFNRRHGRSGHVFQGRFKAVLVEKESHLLEAARYIVWNPVRAGLVRHPKDWKWSSYRATAGLSPRPPFLDVDFILAQFGSDPERAARAYRKFVSQGRDVDLWADLKSGVLLGSEAFVKRLRPLLREKAWVEEIPRRERAAARPSLAELFSRAEDKETRDERIYQAVRVHGYTLKEVAEFLGLHYSTVSLIAKRVEEARGHKK